MKIHEQSLEGTQARFQETPRVLLKFIKLEHSETKRKETVERKRIKSQREEYFFEYSSKF